MVGPRIVGIDRFHPGSDGERCIPVCDVARLDDEGVLVDEYRSARSFVRLVDADTRTDPLSLLASGVEKNAKNMGILTSRFLGYYTLRTLNNANMRVVEGSRDTITRGCTGDESVTEQRVSSIVECPEDPSHRCANCFHKLIGVLQEDSETFVPDGSPESDAYTEALAKIETHMQDQTAQGNELVARIDHNFQHLSAQVDARIVEIQAYLAGVRQTLLDLSSIDPATALYAQAEARTKGAHAKRSVQFGGSGFGLDQLVRSAQETVQSLENIYVIPDGLVGAMRKAGTSLVVRLVHEKADKIGK